MWTAVVYTLLAENRTTSLPRSPSSSSQHGAPPPSTPSNTSAFASMKNPKMLLKEHYDRKGFSSTPPRYRMAREDRDGFVAEVELPDLPGQWVTGGARKTKKEAEQDAASYALKKVNQHP